MKWALVICVSSVILGLVRSQGDVSLDDLLNEIFTQSPNQPNQASTPRTVPIQPASSNNNNNNPGPPQTPLIRPIPSVQPPQHNQNNGLQCHGECVPYYLCNNDELITDGSGLLDIRIDVQDEPRQCPDYLEVCCAAQNKIPDYQVPTPAPQQSKGCGQRHREGVGFRISGDSDNESEYGEFPWMVAILKEERGLAQTLNTYQCGGSLIHENVVLTAAHCVDGKEATKLKIRAGEWDTQTKNEMYAFQDRDVSQIIVHPHYSKSNLANDIALLVLREPVIFEPHISTVCLPPQDANFDRSVCVASGWGKDVFGKEGKYQVILKKIDLPMVPFNQCQNALRTTRLGKRFQLSNSFVCAGGEVGKDTCKGDGGSPLACPIMGQPDRYYQSGIVAWGIGCGENQIPGVYVNVAKFRNWVDNEMNRLRYNTQSYTA